MAYERQYTQGVGWENTPSINTPISAENLNQMDEAIQNVDLATYTEFAAVYAAIAQAGGGRAYNAEITSANYGMLDASSNLVLTEALKQGDLIFAHMAVDGDPGSSSQWDIRYMLGATSVTKLIYKSVGTTTSSDFAPTLSAGTWLVLRMGSSLLTCIAIIPAASDGGGDRPLSDHIVSVDSSSPKLNTSSTRIGGFKDWELFFLRCDVDAHYDSGWSGSWHIYAGGTTDIGDIADNRDHYLDSQSFTDDISAGSILVLAHYPAPWTVWALYAIIPAESGGGTTVVANPTDQATATLGKLQVGSTIYEIPTIDQAWAGKVTAVSGGNIMPNNASFPVDPFTASNFVVLDIGVDAVLPGIASKWSLQYTVDGNTVTKGISDGRNGNAYDPNFDDNLVAGTTMILQKVGNNFSCLAVLDGGGGASALSDLTDTNISTPSDGQFLQYDATSGKWINTDSGGRGYACDLLFENDPMPSPESGAANTTRTYTLSKSINDYDAVMVTSYGQHNSQSVRSEGGTILILKSDYNIGTTEEYDKEINTSWGNQAKILTFSFPDDTTIKTHGGRTTSGNEPILYKVYGLKFATSVAYLPSIYSEEEREVGVYADGKPLYQRTEHIVLDNPMAVQTDVTIQLSELQNRDKLFYTSVIGGFYGTASEISNWTQFITDTNPNASYAAAVKSYTDNSVIVWAGTDHGYFPQASTDNRYREFYITRQYTKTTDQPGSGKFPPAIYTGKWSISGETATYVAI